MCQRKNKMDDSSRRRSCKCDEQANGSLGPKTNRYDIITDSNRFDMSKKNGT